MKLFIFTLFAFIAPICLISSVSIACTPATDSAIGGSYGEIITNRDGTIPSNFRILHASAINDTYTIPQWAVWKEGELVDIEFELLQTYEYGTGLNGTATVWKPVQQLNPGENIEIRDCCSMSTLSTPDTVAPPQPVIWLDRYRPTEPTDECIPQGADSLTLGARFFNVTEKSLLGMIYIGKTAEEAQSTSRISHIRQVYRSQPDYKVSMFLYPGGLASADEPFCVAVELEDTAGNRGMRSESLCFEQLNQPVGTTSDMGLMADMEDTDEQVSSCATNALSKPLQGLHWLLVLAATLLGYRLRHPGCRTTR